MMAHEECSEFKMVIFCRPFQSFPPIFSCVDPDPEYGSRSHLDLEPQHWFELVMLK